MENENKNNLQERKTLITKLIPGINLDSLEDHVYSEGNTGRINSFGLSLFGDGFDTIFSGDLLKFGAYNSLIDRLEGFDIPLKGYPPTNQVLIDLGCGKNNYGCEIANKCHFMAYIGVDKDGLQDINISSEDLGFKIPSVFVKEDMLTFLKRLPNESASLMANGIDHFIINDGKYRDEVIKEIYRVLSPVGFYLTDSLYVPGLIGIEPGIRGMIFMKSSTQQRASVEGDKPLQAEGGTEK